MLRNKGYFVAESLITGENKMPTAYLKNEETVQVSMEDLENYLYENHERIGNRRKKLRRLPIVEVVEDSTSSK
ncbi:MAG: hypothetical protein WBA41_07750 [Rivularia sp. (in: cyanobacteria)]